MALKALDDPKKMQPKITTTRMVKPSDSSGTSSFGWTREKILEKGRPEGQN